MTLKGELVAIAKALMSSHEILEADKGIVAKPIRVIMRPGTYPMQWKSRVEEKG
jgi:H/ACA ribonucleoprotein complex subunit 4